MHSTEQVDAVVTLSTYIMRGEVLGSNLGPDTCCHNRDLSNNIKFYLLNSLFASQFLGILHLQRKRNFVIVS
jgi:hypothetical protein